MPQFSRFQPHPWRPRMRLAWYLERAPYLRFMLRELSSAFVAYYVVLMLVQIAALESGPAAYAGFQNTMRSPVFIVVNAFALVFFVFHAVTWFKLVPRVMLRDISGKEPSGALAVAPNYALWAIATVFVVIFALRIV